MGRGQEQPRGPSHRGTDGQGGVPSRDFCTTEVPWKQEDVQTRTSHEQRAVFTGSLVYYLVFLCLPLWKLILNSEEVYLLSVVISHEKLKLNIRVTTRDQLGLHGSESPCQVPDECQSYSLATAASLRPSPA